MPQIPPMTLDGTPGQPYGPGPNPANRVTSHLRMGERSPKDAAPLADCPIPADDPSIQIDSIARAASAAAMNVTHGGTPGTARGDTLSLTRDFMNSAATRLCNPVRMVSVDAHTIVGNDGRGHSTKVTGGEDRLAISTNRGHVAMQPHIESWNADERRTTERFGLPNGGYSAEYGYRAPAAHYVFIEHGGVHVDMPSAP